MGTVEIGLAPSPTEVTRHWEATRHTSIKGKLLKGARIQEGIFSLLQMTKTVAALSRLREAALPFISLLTNPTMGGVTASFALLGDILLAEPNALIGFAGPRVIEGSMRQKLPPDTDTAEFMLAHGMIDAVVPRQQLRMVLSRVLTLFGAGTVGIIQTRGTRDAPYSTDPMPYATSIRNSSHISQVKRDRVKPDVYKVHILTMPLLLAT